MFFSSKLKQHQTVNSEIEITMDGQNHQTKNKERKDWWFSRWRDWPGGVRRVYVQKKVQAGIAFIMMLNFFVNIAETQILPEDGSDLESMFRTSERAFTAFFTCELLVNLYAHSFIPFWSSMWNILDFGIVLASLLSLLLSNVRAVSVLLLIRAFRVFRLFRRVSSLKQLIEGVFAALPGVINAFFVLILLMGIWSIIGVEFFREYEGEYFGDFTKAMFTMWQLLTMDSWASGVTRRLVFFHKLPFAAVFSISYIFIAGIVMANVVVAVLLDQFLTTVEDEEGPGVSSRQLLLDRSYTDDSNLQSDVVKRSLEKCAKRQGATHIIQSICKQERVEKLDPHALTSLATILWDRVASDVPPL